VIHRSQATLFLSHRADWGAERAVLEALVAKLGLSAPALSG
jgi:ATP phosphoribosyltransferase